MKKILIGLSVIAVLLVSLVVVNNLAQKEDASTEVKTEEKTYMGDPNLQLHYFRKDHYPTAEEAATWHIHKGQFPLENECKCLPLHNFNEE